MAKDSAVYAITEFTKLDQIDAAAINELIADFPGADYVCIMIRTVKGITLTEAQTIVKNNPVHTAPSGTEYKQGGVKGQPPGSTNRLGPR
jgi:hypothetical protein